MAKSSAARRGERLQALLIEARKSAGVTQVDLAQRLGRPQSFVSKYETGERRLDVLEFLEVMKALRADPLRLIAELQRP